MSDLSISLELTNGTGRSNLNVMSKSTPLKTFTLSSNGSCHQPGTSVGLQDIPSPPVPSKSNIVTNKTSNLSHVPCKFFKQGTCTAGTNCTFSHNLTPNSESSVCKYFIKGNCKFGTKCALLHTMSPYGDNRKFMNNWNSSNGGASQKQQQHQYQQIQTLSDTPQNSPYSDFGRQNTNGFSQLTAAIQQQHHQHRQQHHNMQGLSSSIPTNNSIYQYRPQGNSIKHPGISSLRTTPSVWDSATSNSSLTNNNSGSNSNSFIDNTGYLQRIPETDRFEGLSSTSRQQYNHVDGVQLDGAHQSSFGLNTLSKSYDPWTRNSSRFFQSSVNSGSPQTTAIPNILSYSFQAQNATSFHGTFDRLGATSDTILGTSVNTGSGNSNTDLSDIWSSPYPAASSSSSGFNDAVSHHQQRSQHLFDTTPTASAINIPGINLSTPISNPQRQSVVSVEDVDFALHYRRRQLYQNQQQQQYYRQEQQYQQSFSSHANTPEPSSFISPSAMSFTEETYRQRPAPSTAVTTPTPGTRSVMSHDENDAPFFMEDTEDDVPSPDQPHQQDTQNQSLGFPSFTSLVRPTY